MEEIFLIYLCRPGVTGSRLKGSSGLSEPSSFGQLLTDGCLQRQDLPPRCVLVSLLLPLQICVFSLWGSGGDSVITAQRGCEQRDSVVWDAAPLSHRPAQRHTDHMTLDFHLISLDLCMFDCDLKHLDVWQNSGIFMLRDVDLSECWWMVLWELFVILRF